MKTFTAYIEWDPELRLYVGIVPGIPGAHTQAATLDELQANLKEVLQLCVEELGSENMPHFIGLQQIELSA
ncbi:MAG: type II toxin-antitoxin system HicB family antitoxin [Candidatus Melainabacteria bacterium]|nr:type II toxin-antitoxin system HicB family antitoxin [Candidatus Melainabacteria bacterium]